MWNTGFTLSSFYRCLIDESDAKDSWNDWEHPGGNPTPSPTIGDRVCLYEAEAKKVRRILTN